MKKWTIIFMAIVSFMVISLIVVYVQATMPLKKVENLAIERAKTVVDFVSVDEVDVYNGSESSVTVRGRNDAQEEILVFIPDNDQPIVVKKSSEGITKEQALAIVRSEKNPKKIVSVKLGIEKKIPLWEIHYTSEESTLNYYYIDFQTGDWLKKIENL